MSLPFIFLNSVGRLRSGWRFGVFLALFIVISAVLTAVAFLAMGILNLKSEFLSPGNAGFAIQSLVILFSAIVSGLICAKMFEDLPFASLGWSFRGGWWRDLLLGFVIGAASLLLAAALAMLGGSSFSFNQTANSSAIVETIWSAALIFLIGAAAEEALCRGYPLQTFVRAKLVWVAILLTSTFFAAAHAGNPSVSLFGLINTALAGVWFVVAYLKTRKLWFPLGLHCSWNWVMGAILGIPVSGIGAITPHPLFQRIDVGPTWLTGGHYGLEGGAACTIALVFSTVLIWFLPFLKPTAEMLALTDKENPKALSLTDNV